MYYIYEQKITNYPKPNDYNPSCIVVRYGKRNTDI